MTTPAKIKVIAGILLGVILLIFIIQNTEVLELNFLAWTLSMSRSLMILFVLFIGIAAGWILSSHFPYPKKSGDKPVKHQAQGSRRQR